MRLDSGVGNGANGDLDLNPKGIWSWALSSGLSFERRSEGSSPKGRWILASETVQAGEMDMNQKEV